MQEKISTIQVDEMECPTKSCESSRRFGLMGPDFHFISGLFVILPSCSTRHDADIHAQSYNHIAPQIHVLEIRRRTSDHPSLTLVNSSTPSLTSQQHSAMRL